MKALAPSSLKELFAKRGHLLPAETPDLGEGVWIPDLSPFSLPAASLAPAAGWSVPRLQRVYTVAPSTRRSLVDFTFAACLHRDAIHPFSMDSTCPLHSSCELSAGRRHGERAGKSILFAALLCSSLRPIDPPHGRGPTGLRSQQREGLGLSQSALCKQPLSERRTSHAH